MEIHPEKQPGSRERKKEERPPDLHRPDKWPAPPVKKPRTAKTACIYPKNNFFSEMMLIFSNFQLYYRIMVMHP